MTPAQALETATSAPARRIRNNAGIIQIGRRADLLLLNENPLDDVANTRSIDTVILDGEVLDRTQLDAILESVRRANDESRKVDISKYL
jgi:imidazolonepropionase-like amidohydrolase